MTEPTQQPSGVARFWRDARTHLRIVLLLRQPEVYQRLDLHAQALTMKTLLSLVPALAVALAVVTAFSGGLEDANQRLIDFAIRNLAGSEELQRELRAYMARAPVRDAELSLFSVGVLVFTVMSLLDHVERTINQMFGVVAERALGTRLLRYWAMITLGPILLLSSIAMSAALRTTWFLEILQNWGPLWRLLVFATPLVATWGAFTLLYLMVPNTRVGLRPAFKAAVIAGSVWNVAKFGFGWYAAHNVTTQDLYGSLAALPMFILWVYISWLLVLAGAHLCFAFQQPADAAPPAPSTS